MINAVLRHKVIAVAVIAAILATTVLPPLITAGEFDRDEEYTSPKSSRSFSTG